MAHTINTSERKVTHISQGSYQNHGSPYIGIACGTAQVNKLINVVERFGDVGLKNRFQSTIFYDINSDTVQRVRAKARATSLFSQRDMQVVFPAYIPTDTGWNRDPYAWQKFAGGLMHDQDVICQTIKNRSEQIESQPQMIIFFTGFGSHGLLGIELYKKVRKQLPNTLFLTVLTIPKEPMIRKQAVKIWDEYTNFISDAESAGAILLVDDSVATDLKSHDHKLATILAAIEQSGANDTKSGTLVDVVNGLKTYSDGQWLGVNVRQPALLPTRRKFHLIPPFFRTELVEGKSQDLQRIASEAISDINHTDYQLAKHNPPKADDLRKAFCALPVSKEYMGYLTSQVQNWFSSGKTNEETEYLSVDYASANFPYSSEREAGGSQLPSRKTWSGRLLNIISSPITLSFKAGKWAISRQNQFYCHVGQIYVMNASSMPFENIPSISELVSRSTVNKSDLNPLDTVLGLPTLNGNGYLPHETLAPQWQETL